MPLRDLVSESLAGLASRPGRLALTTLGTVLAIGALVATVGLSQTASGQIGRRFDRVTATQVTIRPLTGSELRPEAARLGNVDIPWDAPDRVERLNGTVVAGTYSRLDVGEARVRTVPVIDPQAGNDHALPVAAGSPGLLGAVQGRVVMGRFFDGGHERRGDRVAVLGARTAERLHLSRVDDQPAVFVGEQVFTVIGVIDDVARRSEMLDAVIVPNRVAQDLYGLEAPGELHVRTQLGAAHLIGRQARIALDPNRPEAFEAVLPPSPGDLRAQVQADVNALFLALGSVALLVAAVGIANVTLRSVLERIGEIGLLRALGATRRRIAAQFMIESVTVGLLGGLVGTAIGTLATVAVAVVREWTPLLPSGLAVVGPFLGAGIGLVAGAYPAWRAASIEPIAALRSGG